LKEFSSSLLGKRAESLTITWKPSLSLPNFTSSLLAPKFSIGIKFEKKYQHTKL